MVNILNSHCLTDLPLGSAFDEAIIRENPLNIRYFPFMQERKDLALLAVGINGLARFWLTESLRNDPEIAAVAERNMPIKFSGIPLPIDSNQRIFIIDFKPTRQLGNVGIYNEINYISPTKKRCSLFLRDSSVVLFSGMHLIPYTIKELNYDEMLEAVVPSTADHFIMKKKLAWAGIGFWQENTDQAMIMAYEQNIPFKRAKTCIEGGNCFLFVSNGVRKALIGELSLYLSLIAFMEQKIFSNLDVQIFDLPLEEDFRRARNLDYCRNRELIPEEGGMYESLLVAPVTEEDRIRYATPARKLHCMIRIVKEAIAEELEIPLEHIIFTPQTEFHIDMELCILNGEAMLHDDEVMQGFLQNIKAEITDPNELLLWEAYAETNRASLQAVKEVQEIRKKILEERGLKFHLLPAVFEASGAESALNYCNGIFVENTELIPNSQKRKILFVTTGTSFKEETRFHNRFVELFQQTFPEIEFRAIPNMSNFIAKYAGGIHCLTSESKPFCIE